MEGVPVEGGGAANPTKTQILKGTIFFGQLMEGAEGDLWFGSLFDLKFGTSTWELKMSKNSKV